MEEARPHYPVVIIGAGPAGLRAAFDLVDLGIAPLVIDRGERAGGKLLELERWFSLDACGLCRLLDSETRPILPSAADDILCLRRNVAGRNLSLMTGSTVESARVEDGRLVMAVAGGGSSPHEVSCDCAIVASGLEDTNLDYLSHLGAGREDDVVGALRFEEMIARSAARPLARPSDGRPLRSVGFVACAGSRDSRHPWCSGSCCGFLAKEINLLREVDATIEAHLFCMDLRLHGKGMTLYGEKALGAAAVHRAKTGSVERRLDGSLCLRAATDGGSLEVNVDLVVLSGGQRPAGRLLECLGVETDEWGFPAPGSAALPWTTTHPLVFAAGSCRNPCDIATSVMEGRSAAAAAV
jgi:heterodisulfide reductase subunit A-like polyferredoxin